MKFHGLLLLFAGLGARVEPETGKISWNALFAFCVIFPFLLPVWTALAGLLAWPVEKAISELYFRDAQKKLKSRDEGS